MRIVFLGTPEFACPALRALCDNGYDVCAVFTQPDRPKNRGHKLTPPPVKVLAQERNIPVYQYEKIKSSEAVAELRQIAPDLVITCAFGQLLSQENLDIPPMGTINVHASLLPKYRGAAPIEWCIINGETKTGITTMFTDIGLDTGDMLLKGELSIQPNETAGELSQRLSLLGATVLIDTLKNLKDIQPLPQDEEESSYYPMLCKELGKIQFHVSAKEIINKIRGLNGSSFNAYAVKGEDKIKLFLAEACTQRGNAGEILLANPRDGLVVGCADGSVRLKKLQLPGGKPLNDTDLLRGHSFMVGENFE